MTYYYKLKNSPKGLFFGTFDSETMLSNCNFPDSIIMLHIVEFDESNTITFNFISNLTVDEFKEHILFISLSK